MHLHGIGMAYGTAKLLPLPTTRCADLTATPLVICVGRGCDECIGTIRRGVSCLARAPVASRARAARNSVVVVDGLLRAVSRACRHVWRHRSLCQRLTPRRNRRSLPKGAGQQIEHQHRAPGAETQAAIIRVLVVAQHQVAVIDFARQIPRLARGAKTGFTRGRDFDPVLGQTCTMLLSLGTMYTAPVLATFT
jgi:hypothetical protein